MKIVKTKYVSKIMCLGVGFAISVSLSCGETDEDDSSAEGSSSIGQLAIDLTSEASGVLPVSKDSGASLVQAGNGESVSQDVLNLFAFECHWGSDSQEDYCPEAIKEELGGTFETGVENQYKPYKLTSTSLIGSIAHAQLYLEGPYQYKDDSESDSESSLMLATVTDIENDEFEFVTDDEGGDASKFVISIPGFYDGLGQSGSESYVFHQVSEDTATKFGTIVPKKNALSGGSESALLQTYAITDSTGENGKVLAYNYVGINDYEGDNDFAMRVILIINFENRRFLIKSGTSGTNTIVAAGQGGIDPTTGEYLEGQYYARANYGTNWEGCIDNATQLTLALDGANCSDLTNYFDSDANTIFNASSYLGLTTEESAELVNFLEIFADDSGLTSDQIPLNATESLKHLPDRVTATN